MQKTLKILRRLRREKPSLDPTNCNSFRPISNLPFFGKIFEKVVLTQLQLQKKKVTKKIKKFQSGFKSNHSTETALLKVLNDILLETDKGNVVALVLLDLSSAFDMIDHEVLLFRLENYVGLHGTVFKWFRSFLSNRSFRISIGQHVSSVYPFSCGVPQGSILSPIFFHYICCL